MRKCVLIAMLFVCVNASSQIMLMTDETTDITFVTRRNIAQLEGTFKGVKGTASLDSTNLAAAFIKLSFATSTIIHNDNLTGPDLTKASCFNPSQFPQIELSSTAITKLPASNRYQFAGTLTVKDITKPITFPFTATPNIGGYDFYFTFPIVKKAFNLHCGVQKRFKITVKGYGKRKL